MRAHTHSSSYQPVLDATCLCPRRKRKIASQCRACFILIPVPRLHFFARSWQHDSFVSAVDWSAVTNEIVTCSHDRNAYVWKLDKGVWKPTLVILRINRAATAVKWSPDGKKFAVASGAKSVPICYYEAANDWWISKMIKDHKSTVLCLDWCPNSKVCVCECVFLVCEWCDWGFVLTWNAWSALLCSVHHHWRHRQALSHLFGVCRHSRSDR